MTGIKTKEKAYQFRNLIDEITLIQEIRIINFTKIMGIIIKGIKAMTIKVLNHRTLQ